MRQRTVDRWLIALSHAGYELTIKVSQPAESGIGIDDYLKRFVRYHEFEIDADVRATIKKTGVVVQVEAFPIHGFKAFRIFHYALRPALESLWDQVSRASYERTEPPPSQQANQ